MFRNLIINRFLSYTGDKLNNKKSYLAGSAFILLAIVHIIAKIFKDMGLPEADIDVIIGELSAGLGLVGIRHAITKKKEE